jgi:ribA/ribD-fused uncharacterized protein
VTIDRFSGEYRFLSNFYPVAIVLDGEQYSSVEHAYQAAKTLDPLKRKRFLNISAPAAKRLGRSITLRPDWEDFKLDIMFNLLQRKFRNPELRRKLKDTGDAILIEGNHWGDTFWGICKGDGYNMLGQMLMLVRDEI